MFWLDYILDSLII